jgi:hypothetical protein
MVMRVAAVALVILATLGCDGPGSGPTPPASAHWINYALASFAGPVSRTAGVLAATSLSKIRDEVSGANIASSGIPWPDVSPRSGVLYVAVVTFYQCTRHTEDNLASDGHALYYVHWIGHPSGVCNAAMALPTYRLYTVSSDQLPKSTSLGVKLLVEDAVDSTNMVIAEATVQLT